MSQTKFEVLNRWTGKVQFAAEIDCSARASVSVKMGLAVKWAFSSGADLSDAVLRDAVLRGADLSGAVLSDAVLRGAEKIPAIPALDTKILAAIKDGGKLEMSAWHKCKTTHCRAGWAITLAGDAGHKLEAKFGSAAAGALIYAKSYPDKPIPNFYAENNEALADIQARAATDPKEAA
jgi:hypothetical protein